MWVRNSVSRVGANQSGAHHLIAISEDINERKRAEKVLEVQEKLAVLGRLASSIVHEISKQKRHIPIRQLVRRSARALQALKPCFMMGPLSVAQYLAPGQLKLRSGEICGCRF